MCTGNPRRDGTFTRRYACASHSGVRGAVRCTAKRIDAGMLDAMLISSLGTLLLDRLEGETALPKMTLDVPVPARE